MIFMHKWFSFFLIAFGLLAPSALAADGAQAHPHQPAPHQPAPQNHTAHWSYESDTGPAHWGGMNEHYSVCATGKQQSPIDFQGAYTASLSPIAIDWPALKPVIVNNGHTIQVNIDNGGTMVMNGKTYKLLQFHFHHLSEHTVDGQHYPLEAHFVHKAEDGTLGVLGVFFVEGKANKTIQKIWNSAPLEKGDMQAHKKIKPATLLPKDKSTYRYEGSLTTPPCSQIVDWAVFRQPIELSRAQIEAFSRLYAHNFRPVQPINRRYILQAQ